MARSRGTTSGTTSASIKNARDEWKDSPYFEHTEEFCAKYDQTAFDPDYESNPLEHYEPLIREILRGN